MGLALELIWVALLWRLIVDKRLGILLYFVERELVRALAFGVVFRGEVVLPELEWLMSVGSF